MREIRFRGKRVDNGEWAYGLPSLNARYYAIRWLDDGVFRSPSVIRKTVGQFTGLLDKNGKEIYGGDIIKITTSGNYNAVIVWNEETCAFSAKAIHFRTISDHLFGANISEVIGNIHDNPELLEAI